MTEAPAPVTVLYDGSCPLCRREIGVYRRGEGADAIGWCDVSRTDAALPEGLDRDGAMARFHVVDDDGAVKSGARAFIALWLALPRWRWLGRIASVPPLPALLELAYRGFLPIRPYMQRLARKAER
jgi:predicted DCC family thiol-disulfide oxidoreductase YuxK